MISSVLLRFSPHADLVTAINTLSKRAGLEVGEPVDGCLLPVVIESSCPEATADVIPWLQALPGVAQVDVVYVNFESEQIALNS